MPIYEYRCRDCDHVFDALRSMSAADAPIPCPSCGGERTGRKPSVFASHGTAKVSSGGGCGGCTSGQCAGCRG